jgi:ABC-type spermidine/putrescine transport system permease subunit I
MGGAQRRSPAGGRIGMSVDAATAAETGAREGAWRSAARGLGPVWLLAPAMLFLLIMMVYPVGQLLLLSFQTRGEPSLANYQRLLTADVYVRVLLITFKIAGLTTLFSVLFSYPVAYLIATSDDRRRSRLMFWVLLPFWTSFLVRTFAWIILLGRNGAINQMLQATGLTDAPAELIFNLTAVMIGMCHALMPLCVLTMVGVMEGIDANLPKAALTLGSRPGSTFWNVYFPLSLPGVAAAGLLVFITALGFFITPAFLGGRRETMITQLIIEQVQELLNWGFAGAISLMLLVAALAVFYIYDRLLGMSTLAGYSQAAGRAGGGRLSGLMSQGGMKLLGALGRATDLVGAIIGGLVPARPHRPRRAWGRGLLWITGIVVIAYLVLPAFLMVPISVTANTVIDWPPKGFSLEWYAAFWHSPQWMSATVRSFAIALATGILAMLIGTPAAFALARGSWRGKTAVLGFILAPLIIPRMIIAVALFYLFARIGLVGSPFGLVLGHTILAIPYVAVTVMAVLKSYDERFDQASASLGAKPLRTLRHVTFPLIRTGLVSSFLFAFITSFDELTIALFVTSGLTTTLPKQMWDEAILKVTPTIAAVSTLLLLVVTCIIVLTEAFKRRDLSLR